jgi:hypothetical protein
LVKTFYKEFIGLNNPVFAQEFRKKLGKDNIIVHAEANELNHNGFEGPYSFKYNFSGKTYYNFDGKRIAISKNNYIFLNENQFYTCDSERQSKIKSLVIFFAKDFFEQSVYNVTQSSVKLLDNFDFYTKNSIKFFERITIPSPHSLFLINLIADGVLFDSDVN